MLLPTIRKNISTIGIVLLCISGFIVSCTPEHPTGTKGPVQEHPEEVEERPEGATTGAREEVILEDVAGVAEEYVQENSGDGIFRFYDEKTDTWLNLSLVKIHRDKLAQTKDDEYFVCADFRETDGTLYDLDFFVGGETRDELEVNEDSVSIHKVNGNERYTWNYNENEDAWVKQPVAGETEHPQPSKREHP
ncbi:MAG: hypothetical protein E3K32_05475 [wastewater metagenome]|nr:hypothetical protein [Candidatus Loosdrechtia aerotolerans]